jgi:hypothetical protein
VVFQRNAFAATLHVAAHAWAAVIQFEIVAFVPGTMEGTTRGKVATHELCKPSYCAALTQERSTTVTFTATHATTTTTNLKTNGTRKGRVQPAERTSNIKLRYAITELINANYDPSTIHV